MLIDAYHLPGLEAGDVTSWDALEYDDGRITLRFPSLRPGAIQRLTARLAAARRLHLETRTTTATVQSIDRAAARLADSADPLGRLAADALPAVTGYTPPMLALVLDRAVADWRASSLQQLLRAELGDPAVLDHFVPHGEAGVMTRAFGPRLALHIFAGNVPGVAVTSIVRSLLVKAATLGKTASGEPLLPVLFARALAELAPDLGECLAVTYWRHGDEVQEEAFRAADAVIAYGGRDAIADARARVPAGSHFIEHGPRVSFGMLGPDALTDETTAAAVAAAAARATALFDQQGCVSPHLIYVEQGALISPARFAELLAQALEPLAHELPRGTLSAAEAAAIHDARAGAEFRAIAGEDVEIHAGQGTAYTVIYDPHPDFEASCLNRLIRVKPVERLDDVLTLMAPYRDLLQTVALSGAGSRRRHLASSLGEIGATRITDFERMPWPPASWHHDGRGPLRELLHWVDDEAAHPG